MQFGNCQAMQTFMKDFANNLASIINECNSFTNADNTTLELSNEM